MGEFSSKISDSSNILILVRDINSLDKASAVLGLLLYLKGRDKGVEVSAIKTPRKEVRDLFKKHDVDFISELKALNYTLSIDYGDTEIEKVIWDKDEEKKKLVFQIVPGDGDFSFDNVELSDGGKKYDLTIAVDISDFKSLGNLYETNEYLFKDNFTISLGRNESKGTDLFLKVGSEGSFSETVYDELKVDDKDMDKDVVEVLLNGIINYRKVLEGNASSQSWGVISSMIEDGADFNRLMSDNYFSKTQSNLNLQIKLMQNVKTDKSARIIWSVVNNDLFVKEGLNEASLDTRGRIPFNISSDFDLAFAVYEVGKSKVRVIIESNVPEKYSAETIAGVFDGRGGDAHAECTIEKVNGSSFTTHFFPILRDLYGIDVAGSKDKFEKYRVEGRNVDKKGKKR